MRSFGVRTRFPSLQENLQVYAVIVAFLYTWTILWLFWELPSWLNFLTVGEVLPIFAYALATNFLESLLVLAGLNLICFLLPAHWFHTSFVPRSFLLVASGLGTLMVFISLFGKEAEHPNGLFVATLMLLVLLVPGSLFLGRIPIVKNLAESISDRLTIFVYLLVPLSLLSILFIILRNLW
jgi:hypothetical protein